MSEPMSETLHMARAAVVTPQASRYLQQLCKHWSHKYPVEFTAEAGRIAFSEGRVADFAAEGGVLAITLSAPAADQLPRFQAVIIDHLKRFAFREDIGEPVWEAANP